MELLVDILRGPSGCGKSTWTKNEIDKLDGATYQIVSADHFFIDKAGNYKFNPKQLSLAHNDCMKHFLEALIQKVSHIFVDNTSTRVWEFENYVLAAEVAGYGVRLVEFQVTKDHIPLLVERNVHKVPEGAITSMVERFESYERFKVRHLKVEVQS